MKKCTSCAKDLPDAAMHCVFCGAKQPAAAPPPAGAANAKTVMGWQAGDLMKDMQAKGLSPAPGVAMPPPPAAPPPSNLGVAQTLASPGPANLGVAQTLASPGPLPGPGMGGPMGPPMGGPMGGPPPSAPNSAAAAKTMFAAPAPSIPQGPGAQAFPPAATMPAPSAYGGPNPGAQAFPPAATMPAPSAYGGPAPSAASASTVFAQPAPTIPAPGPGGFGGPGPMPGAGMPPGGGFGGPGPMPGAGMPPGGGFGGPGPLPGAGMPPAYQPPPYQPPQPAYQPPMPMGPPMGQPMAAPMAPPYLASRTAARAGAPRDPYADGLRLVLIAFGAVLILSFVAPLTLHGKTVFRWDLLKGDGHAIAKFDQVYLAAAGVLALVFGIVSLANVPRGLLAAVLGLVPLALHFVVDDLKNAPKIRWQEIVEFVGFLTLVPGLLLRHEYKSQMLPRILATIGALCILLPLLVPEGGADPKIKMIIDGIGKAPGKAKVIALLQLYPVVLAALALLCWLPAPSTGGAKIIAWMIIVTGVVLSYGTLLVMGHIGDVVKRDFNGTLFGGWVVAAWIAFIGYGLATVLGKNLEH